MVLLRDHVRFPRLALIHEFELSTKIYIGLLVDCWVLTAIFVAIRWRAETGFNVREQGKRQM